MKHVYDEIKLKQIVTESLCNAEVLRKLDIIPAGGNYKTLKKYYLIYNINTSHFTGGAWNIGPRFKSFAFTIPLEDILIEKSTYTNLGTLKKRLLKYNLLKYKCYICNILEWQNKKLSLHLDHINGNNDDNRIENLRLLCPNCHSQTITYCRPKSSKKNVLKKANIAIPKNKKDKKKYYCDCGKVIKKRSLSCIKCYNLNRKNINKPDIDLLLNELTNSNYTKLGKKYNVSNTTIRKWLKNKLL